MPSIGLFQRLSFCALKTIVLVVLLFAAHRCVADDIDNNNYLQKRVEKKDINKKEWTKIIEDIDYTVEKKKKKVNRNFYWNTSKQSINSNIVKTFFIIAAIAILVFVIFKIFAGNFIKLGKGKTQKIVINTIEDLDDSIQLNNSDLERLLEDALNKRNFKGAIRVYYLLTLNKLIDNNYIVWTKNKTNNEYLLEMRQTAIYNLFRDVTATYERAWFGKHLIDEGLFLNAKTLFEECITKIKSENLTTKKG